MTAIDTLFIFLGRVRQFRFQSERYSILVAHCALFNGAGIWTGRISPASLPFSQCWRGTGILPGGASGSSVLALVGNITVALFRSRVILLFLFGDSFWSLKKSLHRFLEALSGHSAFSVFWCSLGFAQQQRLHNVNPLIPYTLTIAPMTVAAIPAMIRREESVSLKRIVRHPHPNADIPRRNHNVGTGGGSLTFLF